MRDGVLLLLLLLHGTFELERGEICVALCACVFWYAEMVVWLERCLGMRVV